MQNVKNLDTHTIPVKLLSGQKCDVKNLENYSDINCEVPLWNLLIVFTKNLFHT